MPHMSRREFMRRTAVLTGCCALNPGAFAGGILMGSEKIGKKDLEGLFEAMKGSDFQGARAAFQKILAQGGDPWQVHLSLYPIVQGVLNPPYINPHLPKMYGIVRELSGYLEPEELAALVGLEIQEYARRPKLDIPAIPGTPKSTLTFEDIQEAIREKDRDTAAHLMRGYYFQKGGSELSRNLLLLGSGYLDHTLGHSLSCTAFILREMIQREGQDPWPVLFALSHYFCRGGFDAFPREDPSTCPVSEDEAVDYMLKATTGRGIVNLHHTITFYALARVGNLFSKEERLDLLCAVVRFMKGKAAEPIAPPNPEQAPPRDYTQFHSVFSGRDLKSAFSALARIPRTEQGRHKLGRLLIRGVCDLYQGDYDPHFLTGLGALLWVLREYPDQEELSQKALFQYLDYYLGNL